MVQTESTLVTNHNKRLHKADTFGMSGKQAEARKLSDGQVI